MKERTQRWNDAHAQGLPDRPAICRQEVLDRHELQFVGERQHEAIRIRRQGADERIQEKPPKARERDGEVRMRAVAQTRDPLLDLGDGPQRMPDHFARGSEHEGREAALGLKFAGVTYYDGQGFLVAREPAVVSPLDFSDVKICAQTGTTNRDNAADFLTTNNVKHAIVEVGSPDEMVKAYQDGRCNVMTADSSQLHALQIRLAKPGASVILPDVISKEPLGPVVRQDDPQWFEIVKWTHFAMLDAEELGVSAKTLPAAIVSAKPDVKRLVGTDGNYGEQIGLTKDWVVRIVRAVGNYGESFERNVGAFSSLGIPRGLNQLWSRGGIQYAPPVR